MAMLKPSQDSSIPDVSAVLVSYNTCELTLRAIEALLSGSGRCTIEILVADNASTDNSVQKIKEHFPQVHLFANGTNQGFGAANNKAMSHATGRYFLLINSDAFVHAGAVEALVNRIESDTRIAAVGPRLLNENGSLQQSCFAFPSPAQAWRENLWLSNFKLRQPRINYASWAHDTMQEVDWVSGACLLVRKEVFDAVGGFDEQFFMYSEETDWQHRMRQQGYRIAFEPAALVTHLGGGSGGAGASLINRRFFESLDYYELKHHGWIGLISLRTAMVIGCSLRALLWTFAWIFKPPRRMIAAAKIRLHTWLAARQLTHWPIRQLNASLAGADGDSRYSG